MGQSYTGSHGDHLAVDHSLRLGGQNLERGQGHRSEQDHATGAGCRMSQGHREGQRREEGHAVPEFLGPASCRIWLRS